MVARDDPEQDYSHRVNIALGGCKVVLLSELFNGHIRKSALSDLAVLEALIKNREPEVSQFELIIFNQHVLRLEVLVEYFSIVEDLIAVHKLVENVEYLLFSEMAFFLLDEILQRPVWTVFHEDIIVFPRVAFEGLDSYEIIMNRQLTDDGDLVLNFFPPALVLIGNNFGHQFFLGFVVADGFLDDTETSLPHHLVVENQKLMFLPVQLFCHH